MPIGELSNSASNAEPENASDFSERSALVHPDALQIRLASRGTWRRGSYDPGPDSMQRPDSAATASSVTVKTRSMHLFYPRLPAFIGGAIDFFSTQLGNSRVPPDNAKVFDENKSLTPNQTV